MGEAAASITPGTYIRNVVTAAGAAGGITAGVGRAASHMNAEDVVGAVAGASGATAGAVAGTAHVAANAMSK